MGGCELFDDIDRKLQERLGYGWKRGRVIGESYTFEYSKDSTHPTYKIWTEYSLPNGTMKVNCSHLGAKLEITSSGTPDSTVYSLTETGAFQRAFKQCSDFGNVIQLFLNIPPQLTSRCVATLPIVMPAPVQYNSTGKRKAGCLDE